MGINRFCMRLFFFWPNSRDGKINETFWGIPRRSLKRCMHKWFSYCNFNFKSHMKYIATIQWFHLIELSEQIKTIFSAFKLVQHSPLKLCSKKKKNLCRNIEHKINVGKCNLIYFALELLCVEMTFTFCPCNLNPSDFGDAALTPESKWNVMFMLYHIRLGMHFELELRVQCRWKKDSLSTEQTWCQISPYVVSLHMCAPSHSWYPLAVLFICHIDIRLVFSVCFYHHINYSDLFAAGAFRWSYDEWIQFHRLIFVCFFGVRVNGDTLSGKTRYRIDFLTSVENFYKRMLTVSHVFQWKRAKKDRAKTFTHFQILWSFGASNKRKTNEIIIILRPIWKWNSTTNSIQLARKSNLKWMNKKNGQSIWNYKKVNHMNSMGPLTRLIFKILFFQCCWCDNKMNHIKWQNKNTKTETFHSAVSKA